MWHLIESSLHKCNQCRGALEDGIGTPISVQTHLDLMLFTFTKIKKEQWLCP